MIALLRLLLPYWWRVTLATGLGAAVVASNMGLLAAAAYLIAAASVMHLMALLIIPMYAVRILSAARGAGRYAERLVSHRVTFDVLSRLRVRLYDQFRRVGPAGLHGTHSGDALGRVMADVEDLQNAYLLFAAPIGVACVVVALCFAVLLAFSSAIAWTALSFVVAAGANLPLVVAGLTRKAGPALVTVRGEMNEHLVDSIQGIRDILSNGAGHRYGVRTAELARRTAGAEMRLATVGASREGALDLLTNLAMLSAFALAVPLVTRLSLPSLYVAVPALLVLAAFEAIRPLGQAAETLGGVRAAATRVLSIGTESVSRNRHVVREPIGPPSVLGSHSVAFEDVTLEYPDSGRLAVHGVSFCVSQGSRVALVGPSGAGKTTLVHLLTRLWEPVDGRILIGGRDIRDCSLHDLRSTVGVVAQDTYIFNDSVRNNLLLARPHASTEELEDALGAVGLLDAIQRLPQGLDSWVGEHGGRLSGGERQRLSVARVLLQDPAIVVLDEVTANLDPITERALLDMLHRVTEGRTVLMITHRLVDLGRMDEIVVLDRGEVVERGTETELKGSGGLYRRLLDIQDNILTV